MAATAATAAIRYLRKRGPSEFRIDYRINPEGSRKFRPASPQRLSSSAQPLDAVEQRPVRAQDALGLGHDGVLVGTVQARGDQGPCLGRVLDVALGVQVEVRGPGAAREAVVLAQAVRLHARDRGLRRLDRVQ